MLFVGIDWASEQHEVAALAPDGKQLLAGRIPHSAEGFDGLRAELAQLGVEANEIAVAVEMHQGPLVLWLLDQGYHVYGINPRTADKARDRLSPTGAKDDARDALCLADFVRTSSGRLRELRADDPATGLMRQLVRLREDLIQERTVHKQRLGAYQQQYAPELHTLLGPYRTEWCLKLLADYPTHRRLKAAKPKKLRAFLKKQRMTTETLEKIVAIAASEPIPVPEYLDDPHALEVQHRVRAIRQLNEEIAEIDKKLDDLVSNHPDSNLINSLPSGSSTTRGALWSGLENAMVSCHDADEVAARWGVAPVTIQSGKSRGVRRRRACDHTQMQYLLWFAWATTRKADCWARAYYQRKRAEGARHYSALRAVARRWVRILWTLATRKLPYNEAVVRRPADA